MTNKYFSDETSLVTIFCLTAILALYLHRKLGFDEDASTAIYHTNEFLAYVFPIFGAIAADSWFGQFKMIFIMLGVFWIGNTIVFISSIEQLHLPTM